ncbi:MAG: TRAP transporter fused permease subunit [Pseudomonadota bacterium]
MGSGADGVQEGRLARLYWTLGALLCAGLAGFITVTTILGKLPAEAQYATALTLGLVATFLMKPGLPLRQGRRSLADLGVSALFALAALACGLYYLDNYHAIAAFREGIPNQWDLLCYAVGTFCVLEGARRVEGWVLVAIAGLGVVYLLFGQHMPGVLAHRAMPPSMVLEIAYSYQGIFGIALAATVDVVLAFVILGAAMRVSGAGDFFNFIAMGLTRGRRSGPAQCAIVASTLFGSVNGSAPANVSSTGVLTIPMMRRAGYKPGFAGGIEATASCIGQIMPPIMGVGAFIMSEITGIPYVTIMLVAIVPAFLFLFSLTVSAALEAGRLQLTPALLDSGPWNAERWGQALALLGGFSTLIVMLFSGYAPTYCGIVAAGVVLAIAMIWPATRLGLDALKRFAVEAGRDGLAVLIACAAIGIVIGAISATGLGIKLNQMIVAVGEGNLLAAVLIAALCSVVLGMGLPTAASYLMVIFVAGPSLMELGVSQLQAHFFVFYYAVLSAITPPVALAVFAAAAISGEKPLRVAGSALRLGAVGFLLPLLWIYHPEILLQEVTWDAVPNILASLLAICLAIVGFAAASIGFFGRRLALVERLACALLAVGLVAPLWWLQAGAALCLALLLLRLFAVGRAAAA